jgi:2-polyprenyl-3-methyl-5-hydroxy-6-metoxy-1,4-benzoquinol methylase
MGMSASVFQRIQGLRNTLAIRLLRNRPYTYLDRQLYRQQLRRLDRMLRDNSLALSTPQANRDAYATFGERELIDHAGRGWTCIADGKLTWMRADDIRRRYIAYVCEEIDAALAEGAEASVMEVGCGNCLNLVGLKERYGNAVQLSGIDASAERIAVAKKYFGERLAGVDLSVRSITDAGVPSRYGMVFSMHCLEGITYDLGRAVPNMAAMATNRVVFIEPVWELCRPVNRLYLIIADMERTLLSEVRALGLPILKAEQLSVQSSLKNPSALVVVRTQEAS